MLYLLCECSSPDYQKRKERACDASLEAARSFNSLKFSLRFRERESAPAELVCATPASDGHDLIRGLELPFGRVFYGIPVHDLTLLNLRTPSVAQKGACIKQDAWSCQEFDRFANRRAVYRAGRSK